MNSPTADPNAPNSPQTLSAVRCSELVSLVEQAIGCLTEGGTGKQYDSSWIRPRTMTRQEIQTACEQAYHWMHKVKEALEANADISDRR